MMAQGEQELRGWLAERRRQREQAQMARGAAIDRDAMRQAIANRAMSARRLAHAIGLDPHQPGVLAELLRLLAQEPDVSEIQDPRGFAVYLIASAGELRRCRRRLEAQARLGLTADRVLGALPPNGAGRCLGDLAAALGVNMGIPDERAALRKLLYQAAIRTWVRRRGQHDVTFYGRRSPAEGDRQ